MKKSSKYILIVVCSLITAASSLFVHMSYTFHRSISIELTADSNKTIFFYRDDCSDCKKVFPIVYFNRISNKNVILVNMNNPTNRKYISKFELKSVPTFAKGDNQYVGIDQEQVKKILSSE
nr:thioredoxin domain-containing protein [Enterococcus sp. 665A]MBO1340288.1 thioredoxin [Enterococcus sp. 665A]